MAKFNAKGYNQSQPINLRYVPDKIWRLKYFKSTVAQG